MPVAALDDEVLALHVTVVAQRCDKPSMLRRVERLEAGGQDADANGLRRLLAKGGTATENQYGESSQKEGTRGSLAITHSRPPVHLITATGGRCISRPAPPQAVGWPRWPGEAAPPRSSRRGDFLPSRFKRVPPAGTAGSRRNPSGRPPSPSASPRPPAKSSAKPRS